MGRNAYFSSRGMYDLRRGFRKPARPVLDPSDPINRLLRARWLLANTKGIAKDLSSFSNNGTYHGTVSLAANGRGGISPSFDGSTAYIDCGTPPGLTIVGLPICIAARIYVTAFPASGNLAAIVAKKYDTTNISYYLDIYNNSGTLQLRVGTWQSADANAVWNINFGTGTWHSIYGGWTGTAWILFCDGVLVATTASAQGPYPDSGHLTIGMHDLNGTPDRFFNGRIDSVLLKQSVPNVTEALHLAAEPYAGIYESAPRWRVGSAAAAATRPVKMAGRWGGFAASSGGFAG